MRDAQCKVVIFDLVGVLVEAPGVAAMRRLASIGSDEEVWRRWLESKWVRRFEQGQCDASEFAAGLVRDWRLELSPEDFLVEFAGWPRPPARGAVDLVKDVRDHVRVALLTNTNTLHWAAYGESCLLDHFDEKFVSHELGAVKPDPVVFERVAAKLGIEPDRILFLDDNEINVAASTAIGYRSRWVRGVDHARVALTQEGVLPPVALR